jgi:type III secretion protein J
MSAILLALHGMRRKCARLWPLVLVLALAACGSSVELYRNLGARDANEMLALLLRNGVDAEKVISDSGTATLLVDSQQVVPAMEVLNAAALPRAQYADLGQLFKKEGLISSPTEERVRYIYGITQGLSQTLSEIDGVLSARVHVVLPDEMGDNDKKDPSSAAVLVRYRPGTAIDKIVPKIKELVANSLEGVSYDRVSVTLVKADADELSAPPILPVAKGGQPSTPYLLYGLAVGLLLSLVGNGAFAWLWWRQQRRAAPSPVPATI